MGVGKLKTNKLQYLFIISIWKVKQDSASTEGAQVVGKGRKVEVGAQRTFGIIKVDIVDEILEIAKFGRILRY